MKTLLIFFSALLLMIIISVAKDFAFLNFVAPPQNGTINGGIFMGTPIGVLTFCAWVASLKTSSTSVEVKMAKGATVLVAIMLPLRMSCDTLMMYNHLAGAVLGILFAHLAHWFNKRMVVS